MPDKEKNQLFICITLLAVIVVFGLSLVDGGLTRLVLPEEDFSTISVGYNHGLYFAGPNSRYQLNSKRIGALLIIEEELQVETLSFRLRLPLYINLGSIENIRDMAGMLTN